MNGVPVREVMDRDYVGVSESDSLDAAVRTIREADATGALVLRGGDAVGYLSTSDVLDHLADAGALDGAVGDAMTDVPPSLRPEAAVEDAATRLTSANTRHVVVANGEGVLGLVDATDLVRGGPEPAASPRAQEAPESATPDDRVGEPDDTYSHRSVCEVCGALADGLSNVNGRLVCADCRTV
ncbi:CBS domain-containing protein [Salarchaeum sp. JOR-1]|uniref:CBS domain-containing protein n=1 Tax=Salarchaeum sp. JOR-1 TaxID=2599399 RepID=UPI0011983C0B|nr:CBS domain-containing protein [Salarchaeum sp. JOR-1]QDX40860.1 CBS domain-containing protein [Salarchaeum sp. JOR-1]